ncbi:cobyric acid synthase [Natrononativus amylolyticus]|uniref:cobyric acid synthase n=1 Tax=Natrononativus amylolyticus TaxID=2963434 RepID=UPI0020CDF0A5|nr:cobyric acid synthase [Natrononativus amylolyticus]
MTRTLLVAGTASHVGKSTVAAGLCRHLADRGVSVAPFKAQNMSNNARVVLRPTADGGPGDGAETDRWGEIGVSQFVQCRAARITPTTDCNPVLLKPRGDGESQLVLQGRAVDHFAAGEYRDHHWKRARAAAESSFRRLAETHDVIVAEGAGGVAEINLRDRDLANVETPRLAAEAASERRESGGRAVDILLVVDIERGGAFASLYGAIELLPDDLRERVIGAVITKFRGDPAVLEPGIEEIESRTGVPVLGVLPFSDPGLPEEDSAGLPAVDSYEVRGRANGVDAERTVTIAVPRLPRISNATDLEALAAASGVRVAYLPLEGADSTARLERADAVVLPGTKNTVDDLLALREAGIDAALERFSGPIVGLCGGYQLLGERLENADREGTGERASVEGLGLLPVETRFEREKRLERTTVPVDGSESRVLAGATGTASGYEIHAGRTSALEAVGRPLGETSAARGSVFGTYLHGVFDNRNVREAFLAAVYRRADRRRPDTEYDASGSSAYDRAAALVRDHVDLEALGPPFVAETAGESSRP